MTGKIEELESRLASALDNKSKVHLLNELAWELRSTNIPRAIALGELACELSNQGEFSSHPYQEGLAETLCLLGKLYISLGNYNLIQSFLSKALSITKSMGNNKESASVLSSIGDIYIHFKAYPDALQIHLRVLDIAKEIDDKVVEANALNNIGAVYLATDHTKSFPFLHQSIERYEQLGNINGQADALDNLCKAYIQSNNLENAQDCGTRSLQLYQIIGSKQGQAKALTNLGKIDQVKGDYTQALIHYQKSLDIYTEIGLKPGTGQALRSMGILHHLKGNHNLAISHLKQATMIAQETNAKQLLSECDKALADTYKHIDDYQSSLSHHESFHTEAEYLFNAESDRRRKNLEKEHKIDSTRKEAYIYNLQNVTLQYQIDERERAEQALTDANQQLQLEIAAREDLIADLNAFAHMVAHDLRTPLTAINGYNYILSKRLATHRDEELSHYITIISQTTNKMSRIIEEILVLASISQQNVIPTVVDMAEILQKVNDRLSPMIVEYRANIAQPQTWPPTVGHAPWIEEVWVTYISNAIKHGGSPPLIELGAQPQDDGSVCFWVRDNGDGIKPEIRGDIFSPVSRLEDIRAMGYGLGLSITKRIIDKLGGRVSVESKGLAGEGSIFNFTLPGLPTDQ